MIRNFGRSWLTDWFFCWRTVLLFFAHSLFINLFRRAVQIDYIFKSRYAPVGRYVNWEKRSHLIFDGFGYESIISIQHLDWPERDVHTPPLSHEVTQQLLILQTYFSNPATNIIQLGLGDSALSLLILGCVSRTEVVIQISIISFHSIRNNKRWSVLLSIRLDPPLRYSARSIRRGTVYYDSSTAAPAAAPAASDGRKCPVRTMANNDGNRDIFTERGLWL